VLADKFKDHDGLLRIYHIFQTKNNIYMIMEIADGGDVRDKMQIKPRTKVETPQKISVKEDLVIKVLIQVTSGIAFMN
jgi:serine/threonine protein kinase